MKHVVDELDAFERGTLPEPASRRVDEHLRECAGCREEARLVRAGQQALAALGMPPLPRDAWEAVRTRRPRRRPAAARWLAAAVVVAAIGSAIVATRRPADPVVVATGRLSLGAFGHVDIEQGSIVRVEAPMHLRLERGAVHAVVTAPPRLFVVDTPRARAIDLGCSYEVRVDENGDGTLTVDAGAVALERAMREVVVPAGFACAIDARGAGVPVSQRAPDALRVLVAQAARGGATHPELAAGLAAARPADALTLAHLLPRVAASQRPAVRAAIQSLGRWPADLDPADVDALDAAALSKLVGSLTNR